MLTPDCGHCFFGYSNSAKCLEGTLREIEDVLVRDYGKEPTKDERSAIFNAVKSMPYACRTNRRVLSSLRLMHELDGIAGEDAVSSMLAKISDGYGVKFPVKIEDSAR